MFSYVRATSICFPLNGEGTTPGSIAPERVPILEVGQMAAALMLLARVPWHDFCLFPARGLAVQAGYPTPAPDKERLLPPRGWKPGVSAGGGLMKNAQNGTLFLFFREKDETEDICKRIGN